jgi:hypothetical protein
MLELEYPCLNVGCLYKHIAAVKTKGSEVGKNIYV